MDVMAQSGLGVDMACVSGGGETVCMGVGVDGGMVAGMELDWDRPEKGGIDGGCGINKQSIKIIHQLHWLSKSPWETKTSNPGDLQWGATGASRGTAGPRPLVDRFLTQTTDWVKNPEQATQTGVVPCWFLGRSWAESRLSPQTDLSAVHLQIDLLNDIGPLDERLRQV